MAFDRMLCPICDDNNLTWRVESDDPRKQVVQCNHCTLAMQVAVPSGTQLKEFYSREGYDKHQAKTHRPGAFERYHHDYYVAHLRLKQMRNALPSPTEGPVSWVDVGCGNGALLAYVRSKGYEVAGVELDSDYCREVEDLLLLKCYTPFEFFDAGYSYNVLSMFDVFEHFVDPIGFFSSYALNHENIVVEVPDHSNVEQFSEWKHYRPDEHLFYWTHRAFEKLLHGTRLGITFEIVHGASPVEDKLQLVLRRKQR